MLFMILSHASALSMVVADLTKMLSKVAFANDASGQGSIGLSVHSGPAALSFAVSNRKGAGSENPERQSMAAVFESGRLALSRNGEFAGYRSRRFSFRGRRLH